MRRFVVWMIALVGLFVGYETWGADEYGLPRVFPEPHPLIGSWQEVAQGSLRTVEFRRDHSGSLRIPPAGQQSGPVDLTFAWTTRSEVNDGQNGRLQISFDRAVFTGRGRENISAPCRYTVSVSQISAEVEEPSLILDTNQECEAFWGEYHQPTPTVSGGEDT